jgi:hypothetical protein
MLTQSDHIDITMKRNRRQHGGGMLVAASGTAGLTHILLLKTKFEAISGQNGLSKREEEIVTAKTD